MAKKVTKKVAPASIKKASTKVTVAKATSKKQTLVDIEKTLWAAADKLRVNMDAAEYKHVVLGLIFLKYVSDSFDEFRESLKKQFKDSKNPNYFKGASVEKLEEELEDRDYYTANNVFWVPIESRWFGNDVTEVKGIQDQAKSTKIGTIIDDAMAAIETENPKLKNILPKDFARRQPNIRLGELVDLISTIGFNDNEMHSKDVLGHVYEYFLGQFASAEGKKGGQFYTPKSVVNLIVECLEPYEGRVYDPAMGSGGFFVSSEKFIEMHSDKEHVNDAKKKISLYGQESNPTTWRLAAMNMAIRGMDFNFGKEPADTFHKNQHPDLKADYIMANPPFNIKDWGASTLTNDRRWKYGVPPEGNANFAWVQHMVHHLSPKGYAGIVLANGSMSSSTNSEGEIRKKLIEADLVDCMIVLPGQLFFNTQIPACIWFLAKDKSGKDGKRKREKEVLFIDARNVGYMIDRTQKSFSNDDLQKITEAYHGWRNREEKYQDVKGFCKSVHLLEIEKNDFVLNPSRYVGTERESGDEGSDELLQDVVSELFKLFNQQEIIRGRLSSTLLSIGLVGK